MELLARVAESIAATTRKTEKVSLLAEYFRSRSVEESALSAVYLSGRPFPAREQTTLQVGGRQLWALIAQVSGQSEGVLGAAYRKHGDLGSAAYDVLNDRKPGAGLKLLQVAKGLRHIA